MTDAAYPLEVPTLWNHIRFNSKTYLFTCSGCGEGLQLDARVIERLYTEGCKPMLAHIVERDVKPWLEQHRDCGETRSFAV